MRSLAMLLVLSLAAPALGAAPADVSEPPPEPGYLWRIFGTVGGAGFGGAATFGVTIFGLSKIPNNSPQARDDTAPLVLASVAGAAVFAFGGYWLGKLGDEGSLGAKIGATALLVVGGLLAVIAVSLVATDAFSSR